MMIRFNILLYCIYNLLLLFVSNAFFIMFIQLFYYIIFYFMNRHNEKTAHIILYCMILSIPGSFLSIIGTSTSDFPLSWFLTFTLILFIYSIKKIKKIYLYVIIFFLVVCILNFSKCASITGMLKQMLMIMIFMFSFIIGYFLSSSEKNRKMIYKLTEKLYLISVGTYTLQIVSQYALNNFFNVRVGNISYMGIGRVSYAGLFSDYSFSSLYIATGMIILLIWMCKKQISFIYFFISIIYLGVGILIVNSRTGLYSFLIIAALYLMFNLKTNIKFVIFIGIIGILILPGIMKIVFNNRGGQALLDSSNRLELINQSIPIIFDHIFFGIGLGLDTLINYVDSVPHNLFVQYFLQFGLIGFMPILYFLGNLVVKFKNSKNSTWIMFTVLLGSMFIPDIVSSRFLNVIIILFFIER